MFGLLVGTLSLIGLVKVLRHGPHGYGHSGRRGGGPRRWMLRRLFQRLDTTHGQEKVIDEVTAEVETKFWAAREQMVNARTTYARAVRGEHFDSAAVGEAFDAQQASLEEVKKVLREGLAKVHEALEPEQRKLLGDLIEYGPRGLRGHGFGYGRFNHHHGSWRQASGGEQPGAVNV